MPISARPTSRRRSTSTARPAPASRWWPPTRKLLRPLFEKDHPLLTPGFDDGPAYARAASGARPVFIVRGSELQPGLPRLAGPNGLLMLRQGRQFDGFVQLAVGRYAGEARARITRLAGRATIRFSNG